MTSKYTLGPWHQKDYATDSPNAPGEEHHASVADIHGNIIAQIALRGMAANDNANARLIAAAPDLLEALKDAVDMLETLAAHGTPISNSGKSALSSYNAAIAKAEGK